MFVYKKEAGVLSQRPGFLRNFMSQITAREKIKSRRKIAKFLTSPTIGAGNFDNVESFD